MQDINEIKLANELDILFNNKINRKKTILVLSGGGVKGIAHIGALKALQEIGELDNITTYCGSSIGGLLCALLLIGYTPDELRTFIYAIDLDKLKDLNIGNIFKHYGLDDGKRMDIVLEKMFFAKNYNPKITLSELYLQTQKKLILTSTCLNDKKLYYISNETFPELPVITAIRMTTAIPLFFVPIKYKNKTYIDGACIDNFPIHLFSDSLDVVIGLFLADIKDYIAEITNIEELLLHVIQCLIEGASCGSIKGYEKNTIKISVKNVSTVDFRIKTTIKQQLFNIGYNAINQYYCQDTANVLS